VPAVLHLSSYTITWEPLKRAAAEEDPGLDAAIGPRHELFELIRTDPHAAILKLEELIERFPNSPMLLNWLSAAYGRARDRANAERIARENFDKHPDYLFARMNYAQLLLENGDLDGFAAVFERKFDLKALCPGREVFHISEFLGFSRLMAEYFMRIGEDRAARVIFEAMDEAAPDDEQTCVVRRAIQGSALLKLAKKLSAKLLKRGELPY
jgi:hypothetical protein